MKRTIYLALLAPILVFAEPRVVVSIEQRQLFLVDGEEIVAQYFVGVGKASTPTPEGIYKITSITPKPTWTVPDSIMNGPNPPSARVIPPGKGNPLGAYFLRLNDSSYGIHGTTKPKLLPGAVSHGCIRMKNEDVADLARRIKRGISVEIINGIYKDGLEVAPVEAPAIITTPAPGPALINPSPLVTPPMSDLIKAASIPMDSSEQGGLTPLFPIKRQTDGSCSSRSGACHTVLPR